MAGGGGHQVTFQVNPLGGGDGPVINLCHRQGFRHAQVGIHTALGIGGDQHQAFAGGATATLVVQAVGDAGCFQVRQIDVAVGVIGDFAAHESGRSKQRGGDHAVARAASGGVIGAHQVPGEVVQ